MWDRNWWKNWCKTRLIKPKYTKYTMIFTIVPDVNTHLRAYKHKWIKGEKHNFKAHEISESIWQKQREAKGIWQIWEQENQRIGVVLILIVSEEQTCIIIASWCFSHYFFFFLSGRIKTLCWDVIYSIPWDCWVTGHKLLILEHVANLLNLVDKILSNCCNRTNRFKKARFN